MNIKNKNLLPYF